MLTLMATVQRLMVPLVHRPRLYLQARWGYSWHGAARTHFIFLVGVTSGVLVLLPTTGFYVLEGTWTYLDAQPGQPLRQLYQVAVAAYLLLGLTGVLLLAQTFHRLAELHGITGIVGFLTSWPTTASVSAAGVDGRPAVGTDLPSVGRAPRHHQRCRQHLGTR
uniref:Uncharacterized protein n=1 Tax=Buteo japonicus TaxID=224669 RepID=A0A8C0HMU3_9AVES